MRLLLILQIFFHLFTSFMPLNLTFLTNIINPFFFKALINTGVEGFLRSD